MKRVSTERLQQIAWDERVPIEVDHEQGIALVDFGGTTFYARLEPGMEVCS